MALLYLLLQLALATFGYQKGELEGKNVTTLMPPPFSTRHHQYLQAYHATGHGVIINQVRELVALHKVSQPQQSEESAGSSLSPPPSLHLFVVPGMTWPQQHCPEVAY